MQKITVIGLGYVGASLGMAIRSAYTGKAEVIGYDADPKTHNEAKKIGAVDRSEWNLDDAVRDSDLVILAVPAGVTPTLFEAIGPHLKEGAVVTDTTATKRKVLEWADERLPVGAGFVGGNPLISGGPGNKNASPAVFQGAKFAVVASPRAPQHAVQAVVKLAESIGSQPFFLDKDEHDSFIAAMSCLPILVSSSLMLTAAKSPSWREISKFVGSDFKEVTRLSDTDPAVSSGLMRTNADMITHWMDEMIAQLQQLKGLVREASPEQSDGPLTNALIAAWEARARMDAGVNQSETLQREALPTASEGMMQMFFGSMATKVLRKSEPKKDPHAYDRRRLS